MIEQVVKRWIFARGVEFLRDFMGIPLPYYRQQYREYLQGPRWLILRTLRLHFDGHRCVDCGSDGRLQVHHQSYRNKGDGWGIGEFFDLRTVCASCHRRRHEIGG